MPNNEKLLNLQAIFLFILSIQGTRSLRSQMPCHEHVHMRIMNESYNTNTVKQIKYLNNYCKSSVPTFRDFLDHFLATK